MKAQAQKPLVGAPKFEAEANRVARRVVSGGMHASGMLSTAPTARLHLPQSRSEPLEFPLRQRMEERFAADFSAVRLHRDAPAQRATAAIHARAMTAGSDIFFAAGAFAPGTPAGDELIAHELAHVLQQTGRRGADGRLAATRAFGTGPVQRQGDPPVAPQQQPEKKDDKKLEAQRKEAKAARRKKIEAFKTRTAKMWAAITFKDLVYAHQGASFQEAFKTFTDEVAVDLGFTTEEERDKISFPALSEEKIQAFEKKRATYKSSYPDLFTARGDGWGFLYDCLKKLGRFQTAVSLLEECPELRTLHYHGAIWEAADNEAGSEIFLTIVNKRREIQEFRAGFLDRLEALLLTPSLDDRKIEITISAKREIGATIDEIVPDKDPSIGEVGDNEIVYLGYSLIAELEIGRAGLFKEWRTDLAEQKIPDTNPVSRAALVQRVLGKARDLQAFDKASHGFVDTVFGIDMGEKMQLRAEKIAAYWQRQITMDPTAFKGSDLIKKDPAANALKALLLKSSKTFFALEKAPDLPRAPAYEKRVTAWKKELTDFSRLTLDAKLARLRVTKGFDLRTNELAVFYGYLLFQLHKLLIQQLSDYDPVSDVFQEVETKRDDVRGAHRLITAQQLNRLAQNFGWADLQALAEPWLRSTDRGENHLYLLSDWEPSASSDLSRLGSDIGGKILNWPISGEQLVSFFQFMDTLWRADILTDLLAKQPPPAEVAGKEDRLPLYRQVNVLVAGLPLPKRWEVKNYLWALLPAVISDEALPDIDPALAGGKAPVTVADLNGAQQEALGELISSRKGDTTDILKLPPGRPSELILNHPKTKTLEKAQPTGVKVAFPNYDRMITWGPYGPGVAGAALEKMDVIAWAVPSIELAVSYMREIAVFNQAIIRAHASEAGSSPEEQALWIKGLDAETWTSYFATLVATGAIDTKPAQSEFDALYQTEQQRYRGLLRQTAIVERQILVTRAGGTLAGSGLEDRVLGPERILRELQSFTDNVFPAVQLKKDKDKEDNDQGFHTLGKLHQTLALLQLAPGLLNSSELLANDEAIKGYWGLIEQAFKILNDQVGTVRAAKLDTLEDALQPPDMALDELLKRRSMLDTLLASLRKHRDEHQLRVGFRGMKQEEEAAFAQRKVEVDKERSEDLLTWLFVDEPTQRNTFLTGLYHAWRIEPTRAFYIDGAAFTLVSVDKEFTWFPAYGTKGHPAYKAPILLPRFLTESGMEEQAVRDYGEKRDSASLASNLFTSVAGQIAESPGLNTEDPKQLTDTLLTIRDDEGEDKPITGEEKNWWLLDKLAHATTMQSIVIGLENLQDLTQFFGEVMIEVAVTIFGAGVGQYAKTAADVVQLLQSDELVVLIEAIQKDPLKIVTQVKEDLVDTLLKPETLVKFLLFPSAGILDRLFQGAGGAGGKDKGKGSKKKATKRGGFAAVITALIDLARNVGARVEAVHERVQGPTGALRGRIVSDPRMSGALDFVATYAPVIADVIGAIAAEVEDHEGLAQSLMGFIDGKGSLDEDFGEVFGTLATLELPAEIVPMRAVIAAVGELVIKLMSKKLKGKIAAKILKLSGKDQKIYDELADAMKKNGVDPNDYWRDNILPKLGPQFTEVRDKFMNELYVQLEDVLQKLHGVLPAGLFPEGGKPEWKPVTFPPGPELAVQTGEASFETYPDRDSEWPAHLSRVQLSESGGTPLDPADRAAAEARFGHDFRHVRLHLGSEGEQATTPARALGLTSGSHVYLNPKVSLTSEQGGHVLDHELTHVLQQTGPRPLTGKKYSAEPRRGRSGRLRYNSEREGMAERAARTVRRRNRIEPLPIVQEDEEGIAPLFDREFLLQIVKSFGSYGETVTFQQKIDDSAKNVDKRKLKGLPASNKLWQEIRTRLGDASAMGKTYAGPFKTKDVSGKIYQHLTSKHDAAIQAAIPALVARSAPHEEPPKPAGKAPKKKAKPVEFKLGTFANMLSGYVFARSGVALQIKVKADWNKGGAALDSVFVRYLNLGKVDLASPLWNTPPLSDSIDKKKRVEFKQRLEALGPLAEVWTDSQYNFAAAFFKKLRGYMEEGGKELTGPSGKAYVGKEEAPTKTEYLNTSLKDGKGLRIGTHTDLGGRERGRRESHHTTQFLLAEYFHNKKEQRTPFKKSLKQPWIIWAGAEPIEVKAPKKPAVRLKALYGTHNDRGGPMPAILLSRDAHRQGRLHINRLKSWSTDKEELDATGSQASVFHREYLRHLPDYLNTTEAAWRAQLTKKTEDDLAKEMLAAMTKTYQWMEQVMSGALSEALPVNEVAYYRGVVSRYSDAVKDATTGDLKPQWDLQPRDVAQVIKDAKEKNKTALASYGWVL